MIEVVLVVGAVAAVVLAAVAAAAEAAITRMSTSRAEALLEDERRGAERLRRIIDAREDHLGPVLLVGIGARLGALALAVVATDRWWGDGSLLVTFLVCVAVLFVFAEALPKFVALRQGDRIALGAAPLVSALHWVAPLRWVSWGIVAIVGRSTDTEGATNGNEVSEEELLALAEEAAASDAIDDDERALIASIIEFGDTTASEVMVPRPDIIAVSEDFRIADAIEVVILNGYSRVPAYRDGIDEIVGIVHAKDLMRAERDDRGDDPVSTIMREVRVVPETKRIAALLREMQAETFHLAVVVDEYGGTAGLVTLEDLLEEVVGEIVDEFDVERPMVEQLADGSLRVNGRVPLYDLADLLGVELPEGDFNTVGGLIFSTLGHVPVEGEAIELSSHRLLVERVQGRRIARVRVTVAPAAAELLVDGERVG